MNPELQLVPFSTLQLRKPDKVIEFVSSNAFLRGKGFRPLQDEHRHLLDAEVARTNTPIFTVLFSPVEAYGANALRKWLPGGAEQEMPVIVEPHEVDMSMLVALLKFA